MHKAITRSLAILGVGLVGLVGVITANTLSGDAPNKPSLMQTPEPPAVDAVRAARNLSEAVRFQTISHQDPAEDRLEHWTAFQGWLARTYPRTHASLTLTRLAERTLVFHWAGRDPKAAPLVLMAHQDVVPVTPETLSAWTHPPFDGVIAEGRVWGRGTLDDKGALIALMEATESLLARGYRPQRGVYLVFGHDEERGGTGAQAAARWFKANKIVPEMIVDEGGLVLDQAPVTGKPLALIGVTEKGYGSLKLTATGPGGHASMPPDQTAVVALAEALMRIRAKPLKAKLDAPTTDMLDIMAMDAPLALKVALRNRWLTGSLVQDQLSQSPEAMAMLRTTLAPTRLTGSPKDNVLPETAEAVLNVRLHPRDTPDSVLAHVRAQIKGLPVKADWAEPPMAAPPLSPAENAAFDTIRMALAAEYPGVPASPWLMIAATDARHMTGVSPNIYRILPARLTAKDIAGLHGVDESLSIENLERMARVYGHLIQAGDQTTP